MTTLMLLLARHDGQEEIPFQIVARDYFGLEPEALERKIKKGAIQLDLPDAHAKTIRFCSVPLTCLAQYIQRRRLVATETLKKYQRRSPAK